ncbi:thioredoxin 1 [Oxalobacteraceae bacterium GrIS 2.11]
MNHDVSEAVDRIQVIDGASFQSKVLQAEGRFAVEFMSYGCGFCRAIEPALQEVAQMVWPDEKIYRVDVTADPDLADTYQIGGTPTFIMFLNGAQLGRAEGPDPDLASVRDAVTGPFLA